MNSEAAERMLDKLARFVSTDLDDDERALFSVLVAPGIARAYEEAEVAGFGMTGWSSRALPLALAAGLESSGVRVEGLGAAPREDGADSGP